MYVICVFLSIPATRRQDLTAITAETLQGGGDAMADVIHCF